jgi:aminomethyltransferase
LEARLGFAVSRRDDYIGARAMASQRAGGVKKKLVMLELTERGIPRQGYPVASEAGKVVGAVTSGSVAPWLGKSIAMAYVSPDRDKIGGHLKVLIRDKAVDTMVVKRPFYQRPKRMS